MSSNKRYKKSKIRKSKQLGMNFCTATNRLKKAILFELIKECNKNYCYHCGEEILLEDLSIEHKVPWMYSSDPKKLFWDLENISFSHLSCNCSKTRSKSQKLACKPDRVRD